MWLIVGLVIGAVLLASLVWLRNRSMSMTWYEWLIGAVGLVLLVLSIQNSATALAETEVQAAWMYLLTLGLPSLILLGVTWTLARRRHSATS